MAKIVDRTGETNINNNGIKMTIITYRGSNDIDIQFEDGTIVYNKQYGEFKRGKIKHPTLIANNRIGETSIAKNGMKMTIIMYRSADNIDIQFEDGTITYNKTYKAFKNGYIGYIKYPNSTNRIGETSIAKNGMKMTIIKYRKNTDIDVQFEDGTIVYNQKYDSFKKGYIKHPNINIYNKIGKTNIANNSMKMTIMTYRNANDIDVQFEDRTIVYNKSYINFKRGQIGHPSKINNIKLIRFAYKERISDDECIWHYICKHPEWNEPRILSVPEIYAYDNTAETTA